MGDTPKSETDTTGTPPPEGTGTPPPPKPAPKPASTGEPIKLPDDHPLVKAAAARKTELTEAKAKLKQHEDAQKSDAEKAADALTEAKAEAATAKAEAARAMAAIEHGLTADDLALLGEGGDPESYAERAKALAERLGSTPGSRRPAPDPTQGNEGDPPEDRNTLARNLFGL